jgi:hypothetical protein
MIPTGDLLLGASAAAAEKLMDGSLSAGAAIPPTVKR